MTEFVARWNADRQVWEVESCFGVNEFETLDEAQVFLDMEESEDV